MSRKTLKGCQSVWGEGTNGENIQEAAEAPLDTNSMWRQKEGSWQEGSGFWLKQMERWWLSTTLCIHGSFTRLPRLVLTTYLGGPVPWVVGCGGQSPGEVSRLGHQGVGGLSRSRGCGGPGEQSGCQVGNWAPVEAGELFFLHLPGPCYFIVRGYSQNVSET